MYPGISGGAGGIGGDTSQAGDIKNISSLSFGSNYGGFGSSKIILISAALLAVAFILRKK